MIVRSAYPDPVVPEVSLTEFLFGDLDPADGVRPAVLDAETGRGYTYAELVAVVDRVAAGLAERGLRRGDVVGLYAPNSPEYPVVFHGVLAAGGIVSPANALYTATELAHQLRDASVAVLVTSQRGLDCARQAVHEAADTVRYLVVLGRPSGTPGPVPEIALDDLVATTAPRPVPGTGPDDLAVLPYSSGTTGLPKGVMLTHRNLVANLLQMRPLGRVGPGSSLLAVLPLSHIYAMTGIMNSGLWLRARVVTMPRFELAGFLRAIERHRVDHLYIAPPIALALAKSPLVDEHDLRSVEIVMSAAAPLHAELGRAVADRLGAAMVQGYGLTESSPCTHGIPPDRPDVDVGSIGVLMGGVEARVVDPSTGEDAAPGGRGELWCRGPNIMRGYLNNPGATAAAVDEDGFLHTGDLVELRGDVFHVVDRLKELIKYKGYQIAPAELEAVLLGNEAVADAAVIGVPDGLGDEIPKAFVVRREGHHALGEDEVMAFVAERVAPYKKVRRVEFMEAIPKSPSGKILRKVLRDRERERATSPA